MYIYTYVYIYMHTKLIHYSHIIHNPVKSSMDAVIYIYIYMCIRMCIYVGIPIRNPSRTANTSSSSNTANEPERNGSDLSVNGPENSMDITSSSTWTPQIEAKPTTLSEEVEDKPIPHLEYWTPQQEEVLIPIKPSTLPYLRYLTEV
jgi:hypothetical protein